MADFSGWRAIVVGDDPREQALASMMNTQGGRAVLWDPNAESLSTLENALDPKTWLIAPVSGIGPGGTLRFGGHKTRIPPAVANHARGVIAGIVDDVWRRALTVPVIAYRETEIFAWKNAVPTAEGALHWALTARPSTLDRTPSLVIGYGRVGQVLAHRLKNMGAHVRVMAQDAGARARAWAMGCDTCPLESRWLTSAALIFNTVPAPILDAADLAWLPPDTPVMDLASWPGGFTEAARRQLGARLVWAPSLPGQIAPLTAAAIIVDTIHSLLMDSGPMQDNAGGRAPSSGSPLE